VGPPWPGARLDVTVPRKHSMVTLHYTRHFILLICVAATLAATSPWHPSYGPVASFGLYGVLHSSTIVLSLRVQQAVWRKLLFVAIAASLSMLMVMVSLYGGRFMGTLPGTVGPFLLLALSSGLGAASYAALVRRFWIADLPLRAFVSITLGCVLVTAVGLMSEILLQAVGGLWLAIAWWFAFSAGIWYHEVR
jgi:hypothetical protein